MQYRGLSSRLWLSLRNMIFIAWGRLNWNIVHWVNGLGMNKMLIKMHPSARWPRQVSVKCIPRIAVQIGYLLSFFPQVISIFYLKFSTVLRRTSQMCHQPQLVCIRHQCILPSIFSYQGSIGIWIHFEVTSHFVPHLPARSLLRWLIVGLNVLRLRCFWLSFCIQFHWHLETTNSRFWLVNMLFLKFDTLSKKEIKMIKTQILWWKTAKKNV